MPPGFKDSGKDGTDKYGDLVIWLQMIDKAKADGKSIVFVTADTKEDWWWKSHGHTLGPRRELVEEIRREANVLFHMYTPERFMAYARTSLGQEVTDEAIAEVQETRERDEAAEARRREIQKDLLAAWSELTDEERNYVNLYYNSGHSIEEIAERENRSVQDVENVILLASSKIWRRNEESETRSRATQRRNPPSDPPVGGSKPAGLPSPEQWRQVAEIQEQSRKYMPSAEQMRQIARFREAASKNLPSEREMRQIREMQRLFEQQRKGLGF